MTFDRKVDDILPTASAPAPAGAVAPLVHWVKTHRQIAVLGLIVLLAIPVNMATESNSGGVLTREDVDFSTPPTNYTPFTERASEETTDGEYDYLDALYSSPFGEYWQSMTNDVRDNDGAVLALGRIACEDLAKGASFDTVLDDQIHMFQLSNSGANITDEVLVAYTHLVVSARRYICP